MPATVSCNMLTVVHKKSMGISMIFPDVCKTPAPPAPFAPIPYPNIAQSSDTSQGTTTVKADGESFMTKDANFKMSAGDEAGSLFGMVSSKIKGKAYPKMFSFDCKADGANIMRMTDIMLQNGGSPTNTPPGTEVQAPSPAIPGMADIPSEDAEDPKITELKFSVTECCCGDELEVSAKTSNFEDYTTLFLTIIYGKKKIPVSALLCPLILSDEGKEKWRIRRGRYVKEMKWKLKATGTGGPKDSSNELEVKAPADAKQTITGSRSTPGYASTALPGGGVVWLPNGLTYGWEYGFDVELKKGDFKVTRKIEFGGHRAGFFQKWAWRREIENIWDNKWKMHRTGCKRGDTCNCSLGNGCCIWPIKIKVKWSSGHGKKVTLHRGANNPTDWGGPDWWYSHDWWERRAGVGPFVRPHEFGHLIGLFDEYPEGAVKMPRTHANDPTSIMNGSSTTYDRHMEDFKNWFDGKAGSVVGATKLLRNN